MDPSRRHFAPAGAAVDCPEPAESRRGERPEIKAGKSAPHPLVRANMLQAHSGVTLELLPAEG